LASIILFTTSCASIVSKSSYPISINSAPSNSKVTVTNKRGIEVFKGNTPANVSLAAGNGFFSKANYQIKFEKEGYESKIVPVEFKIDGWYFGNILIGGFLGFLIIDPATGAMFKLDTDFINETLTQATASLPNEGLKVYSSANIPDEWKEHLVAINK